MEIVYTVKAREDILKAITPIQTEQPTGQATVEVQKVVGALQDEMKLKEFDLPVQSCI